MGVRESRTPSPKPRAESAGSLAGLAGKDAIGVFYWGYIGVIGAMKGL